MLDMGNPIVCIKIGGSELTDLDSYKVAAEFVKRVAKWYRPVVVVSAMAGETRRLYEFAHKIAKKPNLRELDASLATGEMQSASSLAMALQNIDVSARSYNAIQAGIETDNKFGSAQIKTVNSLHINMFHEVPVIAGFQGYTVNGGCKDFTTIGFDGSDYSAVWVSIALSAKWVWYIKHKGGIYNENPKINKDAQMYKKISYTKMLSLMQDRNPVLYRKSVELARKCRLPLFVSDLPKNPKVFVMDDICGTWILPKVHEKLY